jgi:phage baseplate assembly protein W
MSPFLGRGWQFPVRFDPRSKQVGMVAGVDDIEESLRILLGTHPGERIMLPAYGCPIRRIVFDTLNESTLTELKEMVRKAVLFFEPRIVLERIETEVVDALSGRLDLTLIYTVRTTNTRHNLVYPLYLDQASQPVSAY